jgi:hypothetical protein
MPRSGGLGWRAGCKKVTLRAFLFLRPVEPQLHSFGADSVAVTCSVNLLSIRGEKAMWIVMYVTMLASLSAMGLIPDSMLKAGEERTPWSED